MSREKQIEEMAEVINTMDEQNAHYYDENLQECEAFANCDEIAEALYNAGYRKSTDIAREIVGEIEQAQTEIANRMQEFINEWKQYSESTVDYFGGKCEAMETAVRLVKSILTDKNTELKKKYESEKG